MIAKIFALVFRVLAILGVAAVILALLLFDFMMRSASPEVRSDLPQTAVVFTGDFERIHFGLDLMTNGHVDRLFITGVNGDAGLNPDRFAAQFALNPDQAEWIANGKIILAPDAHTTIENARETECWLKRHPDIRSIALVTSRRHMARASVALEHGITPISVVPVVSDPAEPYDKFQLDMREFSKFSATWIITLLPTSLWPADEPAICKAQ